MGVKILEAGEQPATAPVPAAPVAPTPSETIVRAAQGNDTAYETDARGRRIGVKRISALKLYWLTKAIGASAGNQASLNLAMSAASVVEIDGSPVSFPSSEGQVEALMGRLDFEGLAAATAALAKLEGDAEVGRDAAKN